MILDCLHAALITDAVYYYVVTNFGNIPSIVRPYWSLSAVPIVTTVITLIIRGIFAYRLWKLSGGGIVVPMAIIAGSLWIMGAATYFAIKISHVDSWFSAQRYSWSLYSGFGCETVVDVVITVSQCLYFRRLQNGLGFNSTNAVIHTLMVYSINTCVVTSLCGICCLITFAALPNTLIFIAFFCMLSKLYFNALLANLNARGVLRKNLDEPAHRLSGTATYLDTIMTFHAARSPVSLSFTVSSGMADSGSPEMPGFQFAMHKIALDSVIKV
ncbi:hypothetical protein OBBRIDRAFT_487959 [Obba rivulosa]|uniref:DUF6534 domain-containing protein n=1 Tax=Obba rivulosa TaxID=1052685 RepID=A0A8E2B1F4_9APHY|nr:hypothetical protein OBBRIDRAFT_487959 [Obba rivulosa]